LGLKIPHFKEFWEHIKILSTHSLLCRKFAAVCWKVAISSSQLFNPKRHSVSLLFSAGKKDQER